MSLHHKICCESHGSARWTVLLSFNPLYPLLTFTTLCRRFMPISAAPSTSERSLNIYIYFYKQNSQLDQNCSFGFNIVVLVKFRTGGHPIMTGFLISIYRKKRYIAVFKEIFYINILFDPKSDSVMSVCESYVRCVFGDLVWDWSCQLTVYHVTTHHYIL